MARPRIPSVSAEIVSVGTELVQGEQEDSNSPYLSKELSKIGFACQRISILPDFPHSSLSQTIQEACKRSDLVILSGGLGPTEDDVTRQAIAKALGKRLLFSPSLLKTIQRSFRKRHLEMPKINERQAYLPEGARAILNPIGSAPGLFYERRRKILVSLPGVPKELRAMFETYVRPYLRRRFPRLAPSHAILLRTTGLAESRVAEILEEVVRKEKGIAFGFYAHFGIVDVKLTPGLKTSRDQKDPFQRVKKLRSVAQEVRRRLGPFVFAQGNRTLESVVFRLLEKKRKTVSVGESCTGGALSSDLTKIPGSSRHFKMGIVAYGNEAKSSILKVPKKLIRRYGAVSEPVARALAHKARRLGKSDYGLGVTGILGPGGGTREKPAGLVYMALAAPKRLLSQKFLFGGDRETNRNRVVRAALDLLRRELSHET